MVVSEQKLDSSEPVMVLLCECCVSLKLGSRFRGVTLSHTLCVFLPYCLEHGCVTGRCSIPQRCSSLEEGWCGWCDYSQWALRNLGAVVSGKTYPLSFFRMLIFLHFVCSWKHVESLMFVCLIDTWIMYFYISKIVSQYI